jgi:hypothetical protein
MQVSLRNQLLSLSFSAALIAGCGGGGMAKQQPVTPSSPGSPSSNVPPNATTIPSIQNQAGWQSCTHCTSNPFARFDMAQAIPAPSLSGSSAKFSLLTGTAPFGGALWFKFLTIDGSATHFIYDLSFYTDNPSAPQALEFNVSQSTGGHRYNFATQCDLSNARAWLIWSPSKGWVTTGVPCVQPPPKTWNHLVWEFERNGDGLEVFRAVTLNGNRSEINMMMPSTADASNGIDIAFQLDANRTATPYSVWLDQVTLSYW